MVVQVLKRFCKLCGFDTHNFLFGIFEANARYLLERKIASIPPELQKLVLGEDEKMHYGDSMLTEAASQTVVRSFTVDRIRYMRECLSKDANSTFLDLGDSNGIFIRAMNRDGISVNISGRTAAYLRQKNLEVVRADIGSLPFKDNSVDVILLFQTLEHVNNPVFVLNEIGRVCKRTLIVSIPFVKTTHINRYQYNDEIPSYQHHVFEFSPADFKQLLPLTPFTIRSETAAVVLDGAASPLHWLIFFFWQKLIDEDTYCGCFKKFYMCHLVKKGV